MIKENLQMIEWTVIGFIAYNLIKAGCPIAALTLMETWLHHGLLVELIKNITHRITKRK